MISTKIYKILESENINVNKLSADNEYELEWYSEAGEDMIDYITADNDREFVTAYRTIALNFDADEHAEMWVSMRGTRGVPRSIRELINDADGTQDFYDKVGDKLLDAIKEVER